MSGDSPPLPPDLHPDRVLPRLDTRRLGHDYRPVTVCGSTNDLAATLAREGAPEGLLVVADTQDGGRGRLGRSWHSPSGANLYLSLLLRPACPPWALPPLTLMAGTVVARVLTDLGFAPRLKWPNDVQLPTAAGLRKVCGVLTEMSSERDRIRHVVVGIGLNVNGESFPPDLADRATSLSLERGAGFDRGEVLARLMNAFEPSYDALMAHGARPMLASWRGYGGLGARCRVERDGERLEGIAVDIDEDGALQLRDDAGRVHRVISGELL